MTKPKRRTTRTTLPRLLALASYEASKTLSRREDAELRDLIGLLREEDVLTVTDLEARLKYYHTILGKTRAVVGPIAEPYTEGTEETKP